MNSIPISVNLMSDSDSECLILKPNYKGSKAQYSSADNDSEESQSKSSDQGQVYLKATKDDDSSDNNNNNNNHNDDDTPPKGKQTKPQAIPSHSSDVQNTPNKIRPKPEDSDFVVSPQELIFSDIIEIDKYNRESTDENLFVREYPPVPNDEDDFISIPEVSESTLEKMRSTINASSTNDLYKGIFQAAKQKIGDDFKSQFVLVFADSKFHYSSIQNYEYKLVDLNKTEDWYSTSIGQPSITLFFPFHLIDLTGIGFRSYQNRSFGQDYLQKFSIYGIDDDENITCISSINTRLLTNVEAKAIFPLSTKKSFRVIHIESNGGSFGLSYFDLFGKATFNQCHSQVSLYRITSPKTYENIKVPKTTIDNRGPRSSLKKKISLKIHEKRLGLAGRSDDESVDSEGVISAINIKGQDLATKIERITGRKAIEIVNWDIYIFSNTKVRLTGIKLFTGISYARGFILFGFLEKEGKKAEWRPILQTKCCSSSYREYILAIPVDDPKEYSAFMLQSYDNEELSTDVKFYGYARKHIVPRTILKTYNVLYENPPIGDFTDDTKPDILQSMKVYYGPNLIGFVTNKTYQNRSYANQYSSSYYRSEYKTKPIIFLFFHQHKVHLTKIKFSTPTCSGIQNLFIFAGQDHQCIFQTFDSIGSNRDYSLNIDEKAGYFDYIAICNYGNTFKLNNLQLFGFLKKGDSYYNNKKPYYEGEGEKIMAKARILMDKHIADINQKFIKEFKSAILPTNRRIVFSALDPKKDDIIETGQKQFKNFVSFYNYGANGCSLLKQDKDNYWETTENNDENSFKVFFNHHSVRLTKFYIDTPKKATISLPTFDFVIYGYNSRVKRWDMILEYHGDRLEQPARYGFDVKEEKQNIYYRIFKFISMTGKMSFAYIEMYGDVIEETDEPPDSVGRKSETLINYSNKPSFICLYQEEKWTKGILQTAMNIYGYDLKNFVRVDAFGGKYQKFYDVWNARQFGFDTVCSVTIFFPYHEVFVTGYHIKPREVDDGLERWAVTGNHWTDKAGIVIDDHRRKEYHNGLHYMYYDTKEASNYSCRVITLEVYDKIFIDCFDIFGRVNPVPPSRYLDEDDMKSCVPTCFSDDD